MTSGVKQSLPPVLAPKTGAEGKAVRNRMPQADFAEALGIGKLSKQPNSGNARADRHDIEAKSLWQRLAEKLETATGRSQEVAAEPETVTSPKDPGLKKTADDDAVGKHHAGKAGEHRQESDELDGPPAARQAAETTQPAAISAFPPIPAASPTSAMVTGQAETDPLPDAAPAREETPALLDWTASEKTRAAPPVPAEPVRKQDSAAPVFMSMARGEPSAPVRYEPAAGPAAASAEQTPTARTRTKDALLETLAEPAKAAPRITVVAQQSIPAPAPSTAVALVESIATGDLLEPARKTSALDAIHASATHASARSLKIQLHPAELGMVTATLRFAGEQLSIELQVETHDAYRHLSSDGDAIVKSLRDLGYDVDRVTVLQPTLATTSAGRPDNGASMPSGQGRAPEQSGFGATGDGNGGSGGRQPGEDGNSGRSGWHGPAAPREQQGNGLYI